MKIVKISLISIFILGISVLAYPNIFYLRKFSFNEAQPLAKWQKMILNGEVDYTAIREGREGFVRALSRKTCSALYYRIKFKLSDYPLLSWRWRVSKFPDLSSARKAKDKDDYAARIYVVFPFLNFSSSRFIEYIWAENLPVGTIMNSPAASNVKLFVVRSGKQAGDAWLNESRNVYKDYLMAFGKKPRMKVGAIAIMCDADNTKTEAESFFDEIAIVTQTGLKRRLD